MAYAGWIPLNEKYPEKRGVRFLVCCRLSNGTRVINEGYLDLFNVDDKRILCYGRPVEGTPTHWMPLPALPETGEFSYEERCVLESYRRANKVTQAAVRRLLEIT